MIPPCPNCSKTPNSGSEMIGHGSYFRAGDSRWIPRYRCKKCLGTCSIATYSRWFRQKKRRFHGQLRAHFASLGAIRRGARRFNVNRKTIARKLELLGFEARELLQAQNASHPPSRVIEFDDLETFEHTRLKPVSVTLAVQARTRRILGIEVSRMPAKGLLVDKSLRKYGRRVDDRAAGRERLFSSIKSFVHPEALIKSDQNPHYPPDVKRHFPQARHVTFLSRKGMNTGGGELKQGGRDPLFSLNHTCASLRMNVTRLLRKTWYTTKRVDRLEAHLYIYAVYHNQHLEV